MSNNRGWSLFAANLVIIICVVSACRDDSAGPDRVTATAPLPTEPAQVEPTEEAPNTIEVTRIVVETEIIEVSPEPPPEVIEPKELVICLGREPESLYLYSSPRLRLAATHVQQGLFEQMLTTLSYDYQARGIEKVPSLADEDASVETVEVEAGDMVYDINNDVVTLSEGVTVINVDGEESHLWRHAAGDGPDGGAIQTETAGLVRRRAGDGRRFDLQFQISGRSGNTGSQDGHSGHGQLRSHRRN